MVTIVYDVEGWAMHQEAVGLAKALNKLGVVAKAVNQTQARQIEAEAQILFPRQMHNIKTPLRKIIAKYVSYGKYDFTQENGENFGFIACAAKSLMEEVKIKFPFKKEIYYITPAVDTSIYKPTKKDRKKLVVGFAGNEKRREKQFHLIKQVQGLTEPFVEWKMALMFENRIPIDKMPLFYEEIDLLLTMSTSEGGPLVGFEAGCCGVPAITTTKRSSLWEVIEDGVSGYKIDGEVEAVAEKILFLAKNLDCLRKVQRQCSEFFQTHLSIEAVTPLYLPLIKEAAKRRA